MRILLIVFTLLFWLPLSSQQIAAQNVAVASPEELRGIFKQNGVAEGKRNTLIFLPGILGSKLIDPNANDPDARAVWGGNVFDDPRLLLGSTKLEAEIFDEVELRAFVARLKVSIYGQALNQLRLRNILQKSELLVFPYDWRQSNVTSADRFEEFLCKNAGEVSGTDIVFVAHSMGGLVLKSWFASYYDRERSCLQQNSQTPDIHEVVFVGTPHYGSPKIVKTLFEGYSMLPVSVLNSHFTEGINKYGYSFESLYELLPAQHNPECRQALQGLNLAPALILDNVPSNTFIDLFDAKLYREWKLPRTMAEAQRVEFHERRLQGILDKAKIINCGLATYDFPKLGKDKVVTYFGKKPVKDTDLRYLLSPDQRRLRFNLGSSPPLSELDADKTELDFGDGTVTMDAASWRGIINNEKHRRDCVATHGELMDNDGVQSYLLDLLQEHPVVQLQKLRETNREGYNKIIGDLAKTGKLVWSIPSASDISAATINGEILDKLASDPDAIWKLATSPTTDTLAKIVINEVVANSSDTNQIRQLYSLNNQGYQLFGLGYTTEATESLNKAVEMWGQQSPGVFKARDAAAKAYNTLGVIKLNSADFDGAEAAWTASGRLGNVKAWDNLQQIRRMQGG